MFLDKKVQHCKNYKLFPQSIHKYNKIPIKILIRYSWNLDKRVLKFIEKNEAKKSKEKKF